MLKSFPPNATAPAARPEAKDITVEGQVRDVYDDPTGEHRIVLVGQSQGDYQPNHLTCHLSPTVPWNPKSFHEGDVVRVRGAIGPAVPDENRVELLEVKNPSLVHRPTLAEQLPGVWLSSSDITADNDPAHRLLECRQDGTFTCTFVDELGAYAPKTVTGTSVGHERACPR